MNSPNLQSLDQLILPQTFTGCVELTTKPTIISKSTWREASGASGLNQNTYATVQPGSAALNSMPTLVQRSHSLSSPAIEWSTEAGEEDGEITKGPRANCTADRLTQVGIQWSRSLTASLYRWDK